MRYVGLLGLFFIVSLFAQSSVWKVTDGANTMYLGGTVHFLKSSDYPLPEEYHKAYEHSDVLVFETDIAATKRPAFGEAIRKHMLLKGGKRLRDLLSQESYSALESYVNSRGEKMAQYDPLQPWMVALSLTIEQLQALGVDTEGVDSYFDERAARDGKERRGLVGVEEHLQIIVNLGKGEEDAMILNTIAEMEAMPEMMGWLIEEWRSGKTERMRREMLEPMEKEFPGVYASVFVERNNKWMQSLLEMMRDDKIEFVLVGTMHMVGKDGLLEQFRRLGYIVEAY